MTEIPLEGAGAVARAAAAGAATVARGIGEAAAQAPAGFATIGNTATEAAGAGFQTLTPAAAGATNGFATLGPRAEAGATNGFVTLNRPPEGKGFATLSPAASVQNRDLPKGSRAGKGQEDKAHQPGLEASATAGFARLTVVQDAPAGNSTEVMPKKRAAPRHREPTVAKIEGRPLDEGNDEFTLERFVARVIDDTGTTGAASKQHENRPVASGGDQAVGGSQAPVTAREGITGAGDANQDSQKNGVSAIGDNTETPQAAGDPQAAPRVTQDSSTEPGKTTSSQDEAPHEQTVERLIDGEGSPTPIRVRISDEPAAENMTGDVVADALAQADEMRDLANITGHPEDRAISDRANEIAVSLGHARAISEETGVPIDEVLKNLKEAPTTTEYETNVAAAADQALTYYHRQLTRLAKAQGEQAIAEATLVNPGNAADTEYDVFTAQGGSNPDGLTTDAPQSSAGGPEAASSPTDIPPSESPGPDDPFAPVQAAINNVNEAAEAKGATSEKGSDSKADATTSDSSQEPPAPETPTAETHEWNSNYYQALGVDKTASAEEIKKQYRRLARELHPDVNPDQATQERFKNITAAYDTLSDPARRAEYDMMQELETRVRTAPRSDAWANRYESGPIFWDFEDDWTVNEGKGFYSTRRSNTRHGVRFDVWGEGKSRRATVYPEDIFDTVSHLTVADRVTWLKLATEVTTNLKQSREELLTYYDDLWAQRRNQMQGSAITGTIFTDRRFLPHTLTRNGTNWRRHGREIETKPFGQGSRKTSQYDHVTDQIRDNKTQKVVLEERLRRMQKHPVINAAEIKQLQFELARVNFALSRDRLERLYQNPLRAIVDEAIENRERPETPSEATRAVATSTRG